MLPEEKVNLASRVRPPRKDDQRHAVAQATQRRLDRSNGIRRALLIDAHLTDRFNASQQTDTPSNSL